MMLIDLFVMVKVSLFIGWMWLNDLHAVQGQEKMPLVEVPKTMPPYIVGASSSGFKSSEGHL